MLRKQSIFNKSCPRRNKLRSQEKSQQESCDALLPDMFIFPPVLDQHFTVLCLLGIFFGKAVSQSLTMAV